MKNIKSIETAYKGYRFRSRLEARWAVFFDAIGLKWEYEIQGFEKDFGVEVVRYLPDFYLPESCTWVEVKGSDALLAADAERLENILDFGSPLPDFDDSDDHYPRVGCPGLLILGSIPDPSKWGLYVHRLVTHHKGLCSRWAYFSQDRTGSALYRLFGGVLESFFCLEAEELWSTEAHLIPTELAFKGTLEAYAAARSARFEHGESPRY